MPFDVDLCWRGSAGRMAPFFHEMHRVLLDRVKLRAWNRVLAVECGDGWLAEEAWRRLGRGYVCGVDTSPAMTELAWRLRGVSDKLEFKLWDGERLPFPDRSFDSALSSFAFHRNTRPAIVLGEIRRVLKTEGELYLLEPRRQLYRGLFEVRSYDRELSGTRSPRDYSGPELLRLVEETGFARASVISPPHVPDGNKSFEGVFLVRAQRAPAGGS
jgi:SAM-dependent methyltransferase